MGDNDLPAMEQDPGPETGAWAIPEVPKHRTAETLKVDPQLVAAPGDGLQDHEAPIPGLPNQAVVCMRQLCAGDLGWMWSNPVGACILAQPIPDLPRAVPGTPMDNCDIFLLDLAHAKGLGQTAR